MAYGDAGSELDISIPAAADLSSHQYKFLTIDANGRGTIATAATDRVLGILQNKPSAQDAPCRIRASGISRLQFGAASNEGDMLCPNAQGFGTVAAAGQVAVFVGAITLAAVGGSGDIGDVLVTRFIL